jgi:uncharacterized membrane protein SpoIIM required for sporulation
MREEVFRRRHQERWSELAGLVAAERAGRLPEADIVRLYALYQAAAADLAWAREHGGERLEAELNALMVDAHSVVHNPPQGTWRRLIQFYAFGLPRLVVRLRLYVWAAAGLYLAAVIAGYLAVRFGPTAWAHAVAAALDPAYHGAVIPPVARLLMSQEVYENNVLLTLKAFGAGIAAGLPTAYLLATNGVMFGELLALFAARHLSVTFWSLIVPHGVLEDFAVWLGGAAGFRLGWSWLRPGDHSRQEALALAGGDAVRLVLAIVPLLGLAALIEGLVTPSGLPQAVKLAVGAADCVGLVVYIRTGRAR